MERDGGGGWRWCEKQTRTNRQDMNEEKEIIKKFEAVGHGNTPLVLLHQGRCNYMEGTNRHSLPIFPCSHKTES